MRLTKNALTAVIQRAGEGPVVRLTVDAPVLMKVCGKHPKNLDA